MSLLLRTAQKDPDKFLSTYFKPLMLRLQTEERTLQRIRDDKRALDEQVAELDRRRTAIGA